MDNNSEIIKNFETLLKQQSTTKPLTLYKDKRNQNFAGRTANKKLNPQCIISNLAKQIKAIQTSENVKSVKKPAVNMDKYKNSSFLPINMLQEQKKPPNPSNPQKFDTQLISNTQLISMVEDAEALDVNVGMTQEFETTFYDGGDVTGDNEYQNPTQISSFPILDISLKEPDPNPILSTQKFEHNKNDGNVIKSNNSPELYLNTDTQFYNCTQILDEIKDIDNIGKIIDNTTQQENLLSANDIEEPLSPVFNVKSKKNDETAPPLVFDLETFESFEKIAMPVVEHTQDKEEAKFLINSQIIDKELILRTCFEDIERISPVIEICDNPLKIDKEVISKNNTKDDRIDEKKIVKDIEEKSPNKCFLKDEILFSSDEEDEFQNQSYKDLPFTCALETSFYDNGEVLDKTMYVGFQTASNKSIQIGTESFCKAKSLLDCVEHDLKNEATLTELIEMCESNKVKADMANANEFASFPPETTSEVSEILCGHTTGNATEVASVTEAITTNISMEIDVQKPKCQNSAVTSTEIPCVNVKNNQSLDQDGTFELNVEIVKKTETYKINPIENLGEALTEEQNIDDNIMKEFEEEIMHTELEDIIRNIDNDNKDTFKEKYKPRSVGFKTASDKNIQISDDALAKSKNIFHDIDLTGKMEMNNIVIENPNIIDNDKNIPPKKVSFKTASNKEIIISDEALTKTKHVFNDFDVNDKISVCNEEDSNRLQIHKSPINIDQPLTSKPFQIKCSKESKLLSEHGNGLDNHTEFCGFKTAGDKNITISAKALSKSIKMFSDIEIDTDAEPPFYGFEENDEYMGFIAETLEKSQNIFKKLTLSDNNGNKFNVISDENLSKTYNNEDLSCNSKQSLDIGFKTASDKDVKISERALVKSRKIFEDMNDFHVKQPDTNTQFIDFKSASNSEVKISDGAFARSRKLFQDMSKKESAEINSDYINKNTENTYSSFKGFQTASNKNIKISAEALAKNSKIFQDIINNDTSVEINYTDPNLNAMNMNTKFKGFQTANNKEIKVTEKSLAKSRKIFQDINEEKATEIKSPERDLSKKPSSTFIGFQTASKKQVNISEEALAKSRKIFQDINDEKMTEMKAQERYVSTNPSSTFIGFQTASKKQVKISEEALAKSRKIFQDINDEKITEIKAQERDLSTKPSSTFIGFQTASKKQVKISEEALAKSRKIFQDINDEKITEIKAQERDLSTKPSSTFIGFQTASKKQVKISEEALAKSRKIFQDIDDEKITEMKAKERYVSTNPSSTFIGFQTASKKQVKISEEALAKSRKIFQDIDDEKITEMKAQEKDAKFIGFQTASKKEVNISEEALAKSKKIFQDIDDVERKSNTKELNQINKSSGGIMFKGFQTASNKNVEISDEAIAKSRKLFQDLDFNVQNNINPFISETPKTDSQSKSKSKDSGLNTANDIKIPKNLSAGNVNKQSKPKIEMQIEQKCSENFEDVDTQILNNFEVSMHEITPSKSKRSGSPILSCPKSKKRKVFQIPYSQKSPKKTPDLEFKPPTVQNSENMYNFNLTYKKIKSYNLNELQRIEKGSTASENIDPYIQQFHFESLHNFKFTGSRNDITKSALNLSDLKDLFLNSVNKKLVPGGWLDIQLKLIVWKLISYEIKFPKTMALTCTAKNVMEQLKYRYDKELYNAERPALRKIFEKDDTSTKTLILCVVVVCPTQDTSQPPELLLTDGWYIIKAVIDKMLAKYVNSGKITVGTKLVTHGAELVGSEQAVSPWEDTSSFRLKIFGNSTRRARWDARLGYHGNGAILSQLSTVALDGGKISKLRVFVTRVYPPLYVDKFEDGSTVTRSERLEHLHQMKFETERQTLLEKIYEDVEKEVLDQDSEDSEGLTEIDGKRKNLDSGSQIAKKMKMSRDPAEFRSHLTSTQTALLEDHTSREREKLIQTIQSKVQDKMAALGVTLTRNVVTLFKVRVAGVSERNGGVEVTRALLSIWRPNEAVIEMIKEGTWMEILNVVPTAMRNSELQISAGRQSVFSQSKYKETENIQPFMTSMKRTCYPIKDLVKNPGKTTDYNEIDTAGVIFEIDPDNNDFDPSKHQFQNVYLTDFDKNMISVNFWGGLKKFGYENVLDTGQIVACINLQKRAGNSRKNIPQYRVTEFSYFTKAPKSEIARKLIAELSQKLSKTDKTKFFQECVSQKINYCIKNTSENVTPYRFPNLDINSSKNRIFIDSPLAQNSKKDENLNLTGLDFDSTFKQETQDLSPKTLLRKKQVKEKIAKLKRYGEPPPLSPIQIINKSKNAANAFKSPLISKSDVSPSVAICVKNLPNQEENSKTSDVEIQCSPVINLNRTYVKRSNPIKLNFSRNENSLNEAVDEFAEDFDCSPPLSLD